MIEEITSLKDERIQLAKSVNSQKGRTEKQKFLIEGFEAIDWAIDSKINLDFILISNKQKDLNEKYSKHKIYQTSDGLLKKVTDTNYLVPAIAVGNVKKDLSNSDFCIVLDNLNDFGNIGTIVRTCHAFGINNIISTKPDFDLFQKKTVDASRGRVFNTNLKSFKNPKEAVNYLRENGFQIITTSPRGTQLQSLVKLTDKPVALVVGNETNGASVEFMNSADITVQIPMYNEVESLNVGVATGISIYELKLKRVLGMIEKQIKSTLGREINVVAMLIRETLDKELKKVSSLSSNQLVFMMVLKCDRIMSILDAQKQFGIPDSEIKKHFQPLLDNGFIITDASDNLIITETGVEAIGKLWTTIENTENKILEDFTESEKQEFKRLLIKIKTKCVEIKNMP
ncbi:MAG: TrmH family RNA methyltransferase [Rikenellaceae bacterium]|nr:TrmH family RNA methyltransferase [Rikenellaceae bacterium]